MTFREIAEKRYSVRGYENTPVSDEILTALFEAVRLAPSACNIQPSIFIVVHNPSVRSALHDAYKRDWFFEAPVIVVAGYDSAASWKRKDGKEYGIVDTAIAIDHLTLAAVEYGLGTCWIGAFKEDIVRSILNIPQNIEIVAMISLGYPREENTGKKRIKVSDFVYLDSLDGKRLGATN